MQVPQSIFMKKLYVTSLEDLVAPTKKIKKISRIIFYKIYVGSSGVLIALYGLKKMRVILYEICVGSPN